MQPILILRLQYVLLTFLITVGTASAQLSTPVEVFKSPHCECCWKWVDHLRRNGFQVTAHNVDSVPDVRKNLGMPNRLGSCHTAKIGGYVIEGHVPAADIQRLLKERPTALGLAVPSMPPGSPGMESNKPIPYETLLVQADGTTRVFAKH